MSDYVDDYVGPATVQAPAAPHDVVAEQSTLGGMLLSKQAIADALEVVRTDDFYVPKHAVIFDAIMVLYSAGEPTDVVTVTDRLIKSGSSRGRVLRSTCTR